jgi:sulfite exporter TauE/SafE
MIFITAFLTGLAGSFHCAGMCGPIALSVPVCGNSQLEKIYSKLLYNLGRICTYAILGFALGSFGLGLKIAGMQQSISVLAGVIIILIAALGSSFFERILHKAFNWLAKDKMRSLFSLKSYKSIFAIGILNGLLPCGFVYIGLIGSVATQDSLGGALYMTLFGLGTTPMMFGIGLVGQLLSQAVRMKINKIVPYFAILIGILFILRGLNLGIPFISPKISNDEAVVKECCTPSK